MIKVNLNPVASRCKEILVQYYGSHFKGLILYGSSARGDSTVTSDIDLLVLLDLPFQYGRESRKITDALYPVQLESPQLISVKPVLWNDYERGVVQLYRNAKREGIIV